MAKSKSKSSEVGTKTKNSHVSPLTSSVSTPTTNSKTKMKSKLSSSSLTTSTTSKRVSKRAREEALEDNEEALLTAQLFGGGGGVSRSNTSMLEQFQTIENGDNNDDSEDNDNNDDDEVEEGFEFEIDRSGDIHQDDDDEENDDDNDHAGKKALEGYSSSRIYRRDDSDNDNDDDDDDDDDDVYGTNIQNNHRNDEERPAWDDPDDDDGGKIRLVDASSRLKKLRKTRKEKEALTSQELEQRLRRRYEMSTQSTARTDWASKSLMRKDDDDSDEDDDDSDDDEHDLSSSAEKELFSTSESLFTEKGSSYGGRLPPNIVDIVRCPDANQSDPNKAVVQVVNFHPGSDPDQPLLLTAGLDKTLRFFQVGEEQSEKIHGIHFPKMPIYSASFLGDTGKVVVSGRRSFFYLYDAVSGNVDLVPKILGRDEKSWERHTVSPDGQLIAFFGNDGYIVLVDAQSKHCVGTLKLNGSVRAITFTPDGSNILASGSDGDVYRWDVKSRKCIERFANEDGTTTSCLAASSTRLAVGAESGVVNLYSEHQSQYQSSLFSANSNGLMTKSPLKSIMNLPTSNDALKFNSDGQILAFSSRREKDSLKLFHVPTQTVFSNWPTIKTPLKYVTSLDFSPQSKFLAIGNDKGKCLLYKLKHYDS